MSPAKQANRIGEGTFPVLREIEWITWRLMRLESPPMERTLEDVVDALQRAREYGRPCSLLIGSGCSVTANIPTAAEIVQEIASAAPRVYARARIANRGAAPSYTDCIAQLTA